MAHPQPSAPPLDSWRRLYESAQRFKDAAPWAGPLGADLFAVHIPEIEELAYCSVMGAGGIEYGLSAHRGRAGLDAYVLFLTQAVDPEEVMLIQDCTTFVLVDRDEVDAADRAIQSALGLRFRGRGAWPQFRRHRPSYLPSHLESADIAALATCLEQTSLLAQELRDGKLRSLTQPDDMLIRFHRPADGWRSATIKWPPLAAGLDVGTPARAPAAKEKGWEIRIIPLAPIPGERGDPDYWARMLLCVDRKTGMIFPSDIMEPEDLVQDALVSAIERVGFVPESIFVTSRLLHQELAQSAAALETNLRLVKKLPALDRAASTMMRHFG